MRISSITRHRAGTTFVFIFFLIFLLCSLFLIPRIITVYDGIINRAENTHNEAIVLEHLIGAVKRADNKDSISVTTLDDSTPALFQSDMVKPKTVLISTNFLGVHSPK